ncbi:MAG: TlpA family protein disulfide reductase [Duncaniella sp.]|nr:TlpA family protein disulfide reductase [Duncaniella sp.]
MLRSLCVLVIALATAFSASAEEIPSVLVKDLTGKTIDTATLSNDGKPFAISFFTTWCKPCMRELKAIAEVYPDWQDETGMKMYIVSIDEAQNVSKVKPLVDAEGWDYDVLLDTNSDLFRALGIQSVPHMIVVDGQGNIVLTHSGYTDGAEEEIIRKIREVM